MYMQHFAYFILKPEANQFESYRENNQRKRSPITCIKKKLIVRDYGLQIIDCWLRWDVAVFFLTYKITLASCVPRIDRHTWITQDIYN